MTTVGTQLNKVPGLKHGASFFADYRKFMDRGNVIDLAVAVVIGTVLFFCLLIIDLIDQCIPDF